MASSKVKNALAKKANGNEVQESKKPKTIAQWIEAMKPEIEKALPKHISVDRIARIALSASRVNPTLAECTPISFMASLMQASQLGLEVNTPLGQAYIIPYKNKGKLEAQFQLGYKGLVDLAYRSGQFKSIYAHVVYENDEFEFEYGLEQKLIHKPAKSNRGNPIWYYAVYHLKNGGYGFEVMSVEDIKEHAKRYSQSFNSKYSPWQNNFDEMAKKTVLKRVLKYAPLSVEFMREVAQDETIKHEISQDMTEVPSENIFENVEYEVKDDVKEDEEKNNEQLEGQMNLTDIS
ncbi:recombinase RecT [Caloranaerobacter azorensis H53214]|uniref:Recombinase RecT n=1 Tax=Caloranaerobacter azorensis H53214 TaxID=1156417 RepID=A0A096CX01_9FIRM|nr:recombination protein RecT [Caloranaerobacter azorensis]KGG81079.1 recombinase RecT [Caloranaerobacter azorensis H53214]